MKKQIGERALIKLVRSGQTIIVRAKNGQGWPTFIDKPSAYNCTVGDRRVAGTLVRALCRRRVIKCTNRGWYSEGHFGWNTDLRDGRGRFRPRKEAA
jgi:hypothetical protein